MKKILVLFLCLGLLVGCSSKSDLSNMVVNPDLNYLDDVKAISVDMSGYRNFTDTEHVFKKINFKEALRFIDEDASAIVYYGYKTCPFCVEVVPVLNELCKELGLSVYYVDVQGETVSDEHLELFMGHYSEFLQTDDKDQPTFYVPQVSVIVDGEITSVHVGAVDSYNSGQPMSDKQKEELKGIFTENLKPLLIEE